MVREMQKRVLKVDSRVVLERLSYQEFATLSWLASIR
jgi:hypothetical protein